jgi:hypothetical protein
MTQKGPVSWLFVEVTLAVAHRGRPVYYRRDPDTYLRYEFCYRTPRPASEAAKSETSEEEIPARVWTGNWDDSVDESTERYPNRRRLTRSLNPSAKG